MNTRARRLAIAILAVIALTLASLTFGATAASAAVRHLGFSGGTGTGSGWLGDVETNPGSGNFAYCVDPYGLFPDGHSSLDGLVTVIPGTSPEANPGHNGTQTVSGHDMAKLNYALYTFGDATTDVQAAAMEAYVYSLSSSDHFGNGVDFFIDIRVPASERAAVSARYRQIRDDTEAHWNDAAALGGTLAFTTTNATTYEGYVDVAVTPASASGVLTISGGTATGTGATTVTVHNGDRVPVTGTPTPTHTFTIRADMTVSGPYEYENNVRLYTTPIDDQNQRIVRHGERSQPSVKVTAVDSGPLSVDFTPVVSTQVTRQRVQPGDAFVDGTNAYAATGTWYSGAAVTGDYTVYGPFTDQPAASPTVPADAPVAATGSSVFAGPGAGTTTSTTVAGKSGWYTWVWSFAAARQDAATQGVLPVGYAWQSVFGDTAESSTVPVAIDIATNTVQKQTGLYTAVSDTVTVSHDDGTGPWFTTGGAPVVATLDGTATWIPGDTAPTEAATAPADAVTIGTVSLDVSAPGTYDSPAVTPPQSRAGWVVWQWRVRPGDSVREHLEPWGSPSQVTHVVPPALSTTAGTDVAPGRPVTDVAHITGPPLGQSVDLTFAAYRQTSDTPVCTDDTRVFDSSGSPIAVTGPGDVTSPPAFFDSIGLYLWIATLTAHDGTIIARGTCGAPDETTHVIPFTVTTDATPTVLLGEPATDVAIVTGPTPPGATIIFRAHKPADAAAPVCTEANVVFTSASVAIDGPGRYESAPATITEAATYAWVETAYDAAGSAITTGACGEKNELTVVTTIQSVSPPTTASTPTPTPTPPPTPTPTVAAPTSTPTVAAKQQKVASDTALAELAATGSALDPVLLGILAGGLLLLAAAMLLIARARAVGGSHRQR